MASWRERIVGDRDRLGWWTLPVFFAVGLAGAVLAGALATVYYSQQVRALRAETGESRAELRTAVEDVRTAADEALEAIGHEVEAVRETLTRQVPFEDVTTAGVLAIRVVTGGSPPQQQDAPPAGGGEPAGAPASPEPTPEGTGPPAEQEPPPPQTAPPAAPPREERIASGFAVASDGDTTFLATSYALVADPSAAGGVVETVEVLTPGGPVRGVVHSWDAGRDLALVRAGLRGVELLEWRPTAETLAMGERIVAAGVTPTLNTVQVSGHVAYSDVTVLVTDLPAVGFLRGAPIVDSDGLVVGIVSDRYAPFGAEAGARQSMVPVQLLCERMLRNCDALEAQRE